MVMDIISDLPDEIISKILSFLETKDVMGTMVLSKRWKSLWKIVPSLVFDDSIHSKSSEAEYWRFRMFVDRSLMSRQGEALQNIYLRLRGKCTEADTALWIGTAIKLGLTELKLEYCGLHYCLPPGFFPNSIYTCSTLVVLKLIRGTLDVPDLVSLPSLKTLSLKFMKFSNRNCLLRLLPNCPLLEDLFIQRHFFHPDEVVFKIVVPSLKKLSLLDSGYIAKTQGILIDAPCLKYLNIEDDSSTFTLTQSINSSDLVEANVKANVKPTDKLLQSLASVERLRLCVSSSEVIDFLLDLQVLNDPSEFQVVYPVDSSFHRLKYLELCTSHSPWLELFMHLLESSPNLKVIKLYKCDRDEYIRPQWNYQPGSVPRCLSSNLETFEWTNYQGTQEEKELSTYILKNAVCLKKASFITANSIHDYKKKLQMLQELALPPRISTTCELLFN